MSLSRWRLISVVPAMLLIWVLCSRIPMASRHSDERKTQRRADDNHGEDERYRCGAPIASERAFDDTFPEWNGLRGSPGQRGPKSLNRHPGSPPERITGQAEARLPPAG